ncbi:hypothetical protein [Bradyrhizobium sp. Ec3.3]|uniref:hypothetical protein n=1 Tax=Bradyrhizobium sp. Ec3.3 TaxID=189753 RepID=UPI00048A0C4C|nr:hypothetical protein [Bradyrhizobium sp. Ec3.3]
MTDYDQRKRECYCCGKVSEHWELMSSNSFGSRDLDQRPSGMFRSTIGSWLQECPYCGYVAPSIDKGDAKARCFVDTPEFRAASLDPLAEPASRRFLVRAAQDAYYGDRRSAFHNTLCAAWVADDRGREADAVALRLKAAGHLGGGRITSIDTRLLLLDVLRRAASWQAAEALAAELTAEELESPFSDIVAFHRGKIEARDSGRYKIKEAYAFKPEPNRSEADPELVKALARHLKIIKRPDSA